MVKILKLTMMTSDSMHHNQEIELIAFGWIRINNIKECKQIVTEFTQKCLKLSNMLNVHQGLNLMKLSTKKVSNELL